LKNQLETPAFMWAADSEKNHAGRFGVAGAAVESHPVNYRGRGRQIIAGPTANPIIAGLMVSPVARVASAADPASQSAGLYRERNIPEHPRTVEAII